MSGVKVLADTNYFTVAPGSPLVQDWSNTSMITTSHVWTGVPSFMGYSGRDDAVSDNTLDPQTIIADYSGGVNVFANQSVPNVFIGPGVGEFDGIPNPTIALSGNGVADFPNVEVRLDTTGCIAPSYLRIAYNVRDLDGSADNTAQQLALQYRTGAAGNFTNIPEGYVADATTGPGLATLVTARDLILPGSMLGQPQVHLRFITANAPGNDEVIGIDDINVSCVIPTAAPVSVTGRIVTAKPRGGSGAKKFSSEMQRGIRGVRVSLISGSTGEVKYAVTNTFGYYRFGDLPAGESYILSVAARKYSFSPSSVLVNASEDVTDLNFVADR